MHAACAARRCAGYAALPGMSRHVAAAMALLTALARRLHIAATAAHMLLGAQCAVSGRAKPHAAGQPAGTSMNHTQRPPPFTHSAASPGGSNCTMSVTAGKSSPRAATSVHSSTPAGALVKARNAAVRSDCSGWAAGRQTARSLPSKASACGMLAAGWQAAHACSCPFELQRGLSETGCLGHAAVQGTCRRAIAQLKLRSRLDQHSRSQAPGRQNMQHKTQSRLLACGMLPCSLRMGALLACSRASPVAASQDSANTAVGDGSWHGG